MWGRNEMSLDFFMVCDSVCIYVQLDPMCSCLSWCRKIIKRVKHHTESESVSTSVSSRTTGYSKTYRALCTVSRVFHHPKGCVGKIFNCTLLNGWSDRF